ncbi:PAS domain-containing sensor histidine kinase [Pseudoduganella violacea]|uniref:Virulence sensor protein BvgS n=1 Tax=Pseudoduganella violacea TaxID=1715466 RepID=A0A7W5FTE8_9BURK|nr:ATP-binding protein [Pseudoduganella violacea]MBB3118552.1 PAS domain S-box-containing protein [Pseudoduganella violacea]
MATDAGMLMRDEMADAAARFGGLLEFVPDAIVLADGEGRIVMANRQAGTLFAYAPDELPGMALEQLLPARFRAAHVGHRRGYQQQPQLRPMGAGRELYGLRKDGVEFPVEISLNPVQTGHGLLVMSAIRDISERRRIEQALQDKNAELAQAHLAKDRFLAAMSHELRTPLNSIIGFTGTMLMKLPGPINSEQDRQLRTIQTSARHLLSLINDLLDLTKIASGKVDMHLERIDCCALLDELVLLFRPQARQRGLGLSLRLPPTPLSVHSDRRALQQILINLLNNALKFTENGEVGVTLEATEQEGRPRAVIRVRDTGVGIAPEDQALLFQAFTQIDQGSTRQFEGTGLGLHLSQKLAELLKGNITCDSRPGAGSTFALSLPLE